MEPNKNNLLTTNQLISKLCPSFPREISYPQRRLVSDAQEFYVNINFYNRVKTLYYSVYECNNHRQYDNTKIDKLFFDFDCKEESGFGELIQRVLIFITFLTSNDFMHTLLYSGKKGFHVYVFTTLSNPLADKRMVVRKAHEYYDKKLDLRSDEKVWDISRVARIPNTLHMDSRLYCIPITKEDLENGIEHIRKKAQRQVCDAMIYCNSLLPLDEFDIIDADTNPTDIPILGEINLNDKAINQFLPCVQAWLLNIKHPTYGHEMGTWEARYWTSVYFRELSYPIEATKEIAKKYFSKVKRTDGLGTNHSHYSNNRVAESAYRKGEYFPTCGMLWLKRLCSGRCDQFKGPDKTPIREG